MTKGTLTTLLRSISILSALSVALLVVLYPRAVATEPSLVRHGPLVLMLIGMSFCWVYGFGFTPRSRVLGWLFSPLVSWPLTALGAFLVFGFGSSA